MKSKSTKLAIFLGFLILFLGSAALMYFKFIRNRPKIRIIAPKTEIDPIKFDSVLYKKNSENK